MLQLFRIMATSKGQNGEMLQSDYFEENFLLQFVL